MTSHNIASVVNCKDRATNFLTAFIWEEEGRTVVDSAPPHQLQAASKRKITACRKKRVRTTNTKLTRFKSMKQLQSHRFHLAELFQNDGISNDHFSRWVVIQRCCLVLYLALCP